MRPRSELLTRSVKGARPPGMKIPAQVFKSTAEKDENGRGEARLFSRRNRSISLLLLFSRHQLPRKASMVDSDIGSTFVSPPFGDAN